MSEEQHLEPAVEPNETMEPTALEDRGMSLAERVVGIFISPVRVFRELRERPRFWDVLAIMIGMGLLATVVSMMAIDLETQIVNSLEASGADMSPAELERMVKIAKTSGWILGPISAVLMTSLIYLLMAGVFHGLSLLMGTEATFKHTFSVVVHGFLVTIPLSLIVIGTAVFTGTQPTSSPTSLAFLKELLGIESIWIGAFLTQIEVFSLWAFVLMVLGVQTTGRISRPRALIAVGIPWFFYMTLAGLMMSLGAMFSGGAS